MCMSIYIHYVTTKYIYIIIHTHTHAHTYTEHTHTQTHDQVVVALSLKSKDSLTQMIKDHACHNIASGYWKLESIPS